MEPDKWWTHAGLIAGHEIPASDLLDRLGHGLGVDPL